MKEPTTSPYTWVVRVFPAITAVSTATVIAAVSLAPNFSSRFGPIDDHEPLRWLDGASRLPLSDYFPTLLGDTELGSFGETTRFRPAYYAIRVGLSMIAGDSPTAWYCFTLLAFIAAVATLGYVTSMWLQAAIASPPTTKKLIVTSLYAGIGTALLASMPSWSGIVTRLGPSELWALLGTSIAALALTHLAFGGRQLWWLLALFGISLAVLSKENFAPLALVAGAVGVYRSLTCDQGRQNIIWGASCFVPLGFLLAGVGPRLTISQSDIYGQPIGPSRASSALEALLSTYLLYWMPAFALLTFATLFLFFSRTASGRTGAILITTVIVISLAWLTFDALVYEGEYSLPRYWMVFETLKALALLGSFPVAVAVVTSAKGTLRLAGYLVLAASLVAITNSIVTVPQSLRDLRTESASNAAATVRYEQEVQAALALTSTEEIPSFMLVVGNDVEYEPVFALTAEILRAIPSARVHVEVLGATTAPAVNALSMSGNRDSGLLPLEDLSRELASVCVFVNMDPSATTHCTGVPSARVDARAM